jgi:hypothetical protein
MIRLRKLVRAWWQRNVSFPLHGHFTLFVIRQQSLSQLAPLRERLQLGDAGDPRVPTPLHTTPAPTGLVIPGRMESVDETLLTSYSTLFGNALAFCTCEDTVRLSEASVMRLWDAEAMLRMGTSRSCRSAFPR